MLLTKEVKVKLWGTNIKHYKSLGYEGKQGDIITVKVEDLSRGCNVRITVVCDYCNKECNPRYVDYCDSVEIDGTYACGNCGFHKAEKTTIKKYGVSNYSSTKECREKVANTMMSRYGVNHVSKCEEFLKRKCNNNNEKYGVEHTFQVKEFREKGIQTNLEKFGVEYASQSEEIQEKIRNTTQQRFGVPNASKSAEIKEKIARTNIQKYGCKTPSQLPEVKEKISQTLYANSSQKASKQQRYICNLYQGTLNFPVKYYCADIYLPNDNFTIEYDGGGHMLNVAMGRETIEEYNHKEIVRYNVIKNKGYKQIKIVSNADKLPSDQILLQMLSESRNYFTATSHTWQTYDIDKSLLFNAEHKQGIPYDFGELRTIKDSDIHTIKDSDIIQNNPTLS